MPPTRNPTPRFCRPRIPRRRSGRPSRTRLALIGGAALALAIVALLGSASTPPAALAEVTPRVGFRATVLGWSSWYGSYDLGSAGTGWCIDHGLRAPDPAFRYVPSVASDLGDDQLAAMAWAVTAHVDATDPVDSASVMLVLHDLRGASYPFGRIDVDRLGPGELAGFGGHEADVIARARAIKAEALAHQHLRGPFALRVTLSPGAVTTGLVTTGLVTATVTDASGAPVVGAGLHIDATGARLTPTSMSASGDDGSLSQTYAVVDSAAGASFRAAAIVPDPKLAVLASSTTPAQRVAHPAWLAYDADTTLAAPPTTTTAPAPSSTTTLPPTTTPPPGPPPTTSTSTSTSTTAGPPASSPTTVTTTPSNTTSSTVAIPPSRVVPSTPSTVGDTPRTGRLPVTGGRLTGWALAGLGLVALGTSIVGLSRRSAA